MPGDFQHPWLIAVHGGAGYHSAKSESEKSVKHALRSACKSAIEVLKSENKSCIDAAEHAICVLEDDDCLNAGYGSNLTIDGTVECDASMMDGVTHDFGSVGAVQGVKNPISLSRAIMQNSRKPQTLGRIPPLTLTGLGARAFAESTGLHLVEPDALISANAKRDWQIWRTRFEEANIPEPGSGTKVDTGTKTTHLGRNAAGPSSNDSGIVDSVTTAAASTVGTVEEEKLAEHGSRSILEDTVGAVACDTGGGLAAGVSSGGLLLKYPGRVGEAAVFGAGVWAHSPPGPGRGPGQRNGGVACSVSGAGEAIIRTSFARTLAEALYAAPPEETHNVLETQLQAFCDEISARGEEPNVGVLVVMKEFVEKDEERDSASSTSEFDLDDDDDDSDLSLSPEPGEHANQGSIYPGSSHEHHNLDLEEAYRRSRSDPGPRPAQEARAKVNLAAKPKPKPKPKPRTRTLLRLRLWCAFTTESMALGYASSEDERLRALIIRHETHRRRNTDGGLDVGTGTSTSTGVEVKRGIHITALPLSR